MAEQKSKISNTFRFKSFADRIGEIDLRRLTLYHIGHENEELPEDNETFFHQTLKKWMVLNLTDEYSLFARKVQNIVTLPQLLHKKDYVVDLLLEKLAYATNLSLQPLLDLLYVLARDLREDFYPYFQRALDRLVCLLNTQDADQLEWTLVCLAHLFKALKPFLKRNIGVVFNCVLPLLCLAQYKEHITNFAVECFSFIARNVRDYEKFFEFILETIAREQVESVQGCGGLLFEIMRGVKGKFHSTAGDFLEFMFKFIARDKPIRHQQMQLLNDITEYCVLHLLTFIQPKEMPSFWGKLCEAPDSCLITAKGNRLCRIFLQAVEFKQCRYLAEMDVFVSCLLRLIDKCIKDDSTGMETLRTCTQIFPDQTPLKLDQWDDTTCKLIEIYAKFSSLYDRDHPLYGNYEEKQKSLSDMHNILLTQHNIKLNADQISDAIDQLHSWYYSTKRRKIKRGSKFGKLHNHYLKLCTFLPEKRHKVKIVCSICQRNFYTDHNFKYHLSKIHKIGNQMFQCPQCGKKLVSKSALQCHAQRIHCEKKYSCEFCGKLFAIPSELRIHTFVHTAEKPHVCELCGKGFRLRNNLGLHVTRMHTKIRAFKCTMCTKDFLKNCDLKDHIKTHLNIRDKICETCGKGFTNCHSLIRHRQIHSEIKKFSCKLCDAKFHQFVGLNGHMKRIHNVVREDANN